MRQQTSCSRFEWEYSGSKSIDVDVFSYWHLYVRLLSLGLVDLLTNVYQALAWTWLDQQKTMQVDREVELPTGR